MVRLWWNSQEKRVISVVEKFTIKYVSPVLSAQEISSVHSSTQMFESMTVSQQVLYVDSPFISIFTCLFVFVFPQNCTKVEILIIIYLLLQVKARSTAREVIATYSVDEIFIELVIQLPQNHPLGSITVDSGRRVGVAVQQWRNWMLQLSTYLTHQVEKMHNVMFSCVIQSHRAIMNVNVWGSVSSEWQYNGGPGALEEQCG